MRFVNLTFVWSTQRRVAAADSLLVRSVRRARCADSSAVASRLAQGCKSDLDASICLVTQYDSRVSQLASDRRPP